MLSTLTKHRLVVGLTLRAYPGVMGRRSGVRA